MFFDANQTAAASSMSGQAILALGRKGEARTRNLEKIWANSAWEINQMQEPTRWVGWDEALASVVHDLEKIALSLVDGIEGAAMEFGRQMGREIGAAGALAAQAGLLAAMEIRRERRVLWTRSVKAGRLVARQSRKMSWKAKAMASALAVALSTMAWQTHAQRSLPSEGSGQAPGANSQLGDKGLLSPQLATASDASQARLDAVVSQLRGEAIAPPLAAHWAGGATPTLRPLDAGLKASPLQMDQAYSLDSTLAKASSAPNQASVAPVAPRVEASFSGGALTMLAQPSGGMRLRAPVDEGAAMNALSQQLAAEFRADPVQVASWAQEATRQAQARGIEPTLALAVIAVESGFHATARSKVGAVGLMQVILHYHPDAVKEVGGAQKAAAPMGNIAVGVSVLDEVYKLSQKRGGGWPLALGYYNGSSNDPKRAYANKVLKEKARIEAMLQSQKERLANNAQYAQANERT